jgi:Protein of unknown function (DUF3501)
MNEDRLGPAEVRTGAAYEAERAAGRAHLANTAADRRVSLGTELVLVFETRDTVRASLEELLRGERVGDERRIAAETAAFADMIPGGHELGATLYLDIADPAVLADRLAELSDIGAAVALAVSGARVTARSDTALSGAGAVHLVFALDDVARQTLLDGGTAAVVVEHPRYSATAVLDADQVRAVTTDLRR